MIKKFLILSVLLSSILMYSQELKTITHEKYEIKVPEKWEENKMFYSSSLSLMVLKPKSETDLNPVEGIVIKHVKSQKTEFNSGYQEYISLLKGYYKENFKIVETENLVSNKHPIRKIITEIKSKINGKKRKNIMIYSFRNNESLMITLTGTKENFEKNINLYERIYKSLLIK